MNINATYLMVVFNNDARRVFQQVNGIFESVAMRISRTSDENLFQQTKARYAGELKERLEIIFKNLKEAHRDMQDMEQFSHRAKDAINYYLQQFIQYGN